MSVARRTAAASARFLLGSDRARALGLRARDFKRTSEYRSLAEGRRSIAELADYRDAYRGRRCVIIGNGPSLREMDLSPLRDEITFGLNRAYLMYERLGFKTSFLVAVNRYVVEQCASEIVDAGLPTFISWHSRAHLPAGARPTYLCSISRPGFYGDVRDGLWEGATVTYVTLQLAFHMGFSEVVLIGVDHSFATQGRPHELVTSSGDDFNHFDPAYFGAGFRWQLPDLETSEVAYRMARDAYAAGGRSITDATVNGRLRVFPKAHFAALFGSSAGKVVEG